MMLKPRCVAWTAVLGGLLAATNAQAHEFFSTKITWSREISRLVYKRCAGCHHDGSGKAFSLTTFEAARPWAKAIKEEVLNRRMPPWGAVKGFGDFKHDRGLTQEEISLFADWVEGGAPEGEKQYLPKVPRFEAPFDKPVAAARVAIVNGSLTLQENISLRGIAALAGAPKKPVRVIATLPDGSVEPLIWVLDAAQSAKREFEYKSPISLPAKTVITVDPPVGRWRLSFQAGRAKVAAKSAD